MFIYYGDYLHLFLLLFMCKMIWAKREQIKTIRIIVRIDCTVYV